MSRAIRMGLGLFGSFFVALALSSYCLSDPSFFKNSAKAGVLNNYGGLIGSHLADGLYRYFGAAAWLLPVMSLHLMKCDLQKRLKWSVAFGWVLAIASTALFAEIFITSSSSAWPATPGGALAAIVVYQGPWLIGGVGLFFGNSLCFFSSLFLIGQVEPIAFFTDLYYFLGHILGTVFCTIFRFKKSKLMPNVFHKSPSLESIKLSSNSLIKPITDAMRVSENFSVQAEKIIEKLKEYEIHGKITAIIPGPVIVRFELQLAAGERSQKVASLSKDLARVLKLGHLHVVQHIPGKAVMGLEIPQKNRQPIPFLPLLSHIPSAYNLPLALGVTPQGDPVLLDLAQLPHLLVAGATGAGKSVAMNVMLMSLMTTRTPDQLKLVLIDPKILEFACYKGRQHLAMPVITEPNHSVAALRWCVQVMQDRYQTLAQHQVQHIRQYHAKVGPKVASNMPYLVVVIDELADLMLMTKKAVEEPIARLAQKARACGIHLVIATQRPSVDVITGLIKANIPARLAFAVSSKIDSRTIIDQQGAEDLLGAGDSYLLVPAAHQVARVHGAYLSDLDRQELLDQSSPLEPSYIISLESVVAEYGDQAFDDLT